MAFAHAFSESNGCTEAIALSRCLGSVQGPLTILPTDTHWISSNPMRQYPSHNTWQATLYLRRNNALESAMPANGLVPDSAVHLRSHSTPIQFRELVCIVSISSPLDGPTNANMILQHLARTTICEQAQAAGFACLGIIQASEATDFHRFEQWLDSGYGGAMEYLSRRREAYRHPSGVLPHCKSIIMLALPYASHPRTTPAKSPHPVTNHAPSLAESGRGTIAAYASASVDYHDWIHDALRDIVRSLESMFPTMRSRAVVDSAPLLERHFGHRAGLGWVGKNTLLLNRQLGSYFFLAAILSQADLGSAMMGGANASIAPHGLSDPIETATKAEPDHLPTDHCGSCTACLDACPTSAFVRPHVLDATRCISYWTIEHRGTIPLAIRSELGDWLFGCDACQTVCPWNRKRDVKVIPALQPDAWSNKTDCVFWLTLTHEEFRRRFRKTPFWRTRLEGMQRNAIIVAANTNCHAAIPAITPFLNGDDDVLRETAQWAITKLMSSP
jgi:epoxyqueuosine reductase